ncbi:MULTISPECIES: CAP domain-containing protein [Streptomyces]|uniref:CAP domain-containing protein n=1 Tax=Streptomyces TaxID=1883 RepID=UPI0006FD3A94|nr:MULTISPECIES: CAP domain-containing protein [Streptomyces]KQX93778.1 SCP-like extracellular [Streptomyces sp. Root1319]KQZ18124.1 SCP-like extracellular [Streptomyces sp. Root55]MDX3060753.1 CAP domain-containing protein [Streptomyces sp. ND04-05B]WRY84422.1 CAP domain-containing protein [Streptomyces clavifer]WUC30188.1 CAP domain-containing protein [Streptomyces clavifer]
MGRHRRAGAAPAAEQQPDGAAGGHRGARRKKRAGVPLRTGLLGVSAAVAVGAVAVASGLLPGGDTYSVSGGPAADQVRAGGAPDLLTQGGSSAEPTDRASASASAEATRGGDRSAAPSKSASADPGKKPSASASKQVEKKEKPDRTTAPATESQKSSTPATKAPTAPKTSSASPSRTAEAPAGTSAQAAVIALVNQERAKAGCSPVTARASLTALAQAFSEDMAARGFFDHTDPDGATPWDRAAKAGVEGLGGENIARGQADAQAVMDAWMNSDGHRANILNCDYTTLGVGVHMGSGGPWWTQDFGF